MNPTSYLQRKHTDVSIGGKFFLIFFKVCYLKARILLEGSFMFHSVFRPLDVPSTSYRSSDLRWGLVRICIYCFFLK